MTVTAAPRALRRAAGSVARIGVAIAIVVALAFGIPWLVDLVWK